MHSEIRLVKVLAKFYASRKPRGPPLITFISKNYVLGTWISLLFLHLLELQVASSPCGIATSLKELWLRTMPMMLL